MNDLTENYVRSGSKLKKYFDLKMLHYYNGVHIYYRASLGTHKFWPI